MGIRLIVLSHVESDGYEESLSLIGLTRRPEYSRKEPHSETVPETDTGGQVEYTKALERTVLKELGKLPL